MSHVIDISRDHETGEITQFTVLEEGQPELIKATSENILLYDPSDELPFDNGLKGFLEGKEALLINDENPEILVAPTNNDYCYMIRVRGRTVESTPRQSEQALYGLKEAVVNGDYDELLDLFDEIVSNQVRRPVINALHQTFDEQERIEVTGSGWLIDDYYLVNWEASMYVKTDDPDEPDVRRGSGGVVETDKSHEFVELNIRRDIEPITVSISGENYRLSEREMLFLAKVKWLLSRREYHSDQPFWSYADRHGGASVDWKTGEPLTEDDDDSDDDEPDLDRFSL